MKVTFETKAWVSEYNHCTPEQLGTPAGAASLYYSRVELRGDYTFAGNATVTLDLCGERELVDNKIASLREQAASVRAEATAKVTKIESQIQQLLAIENKPSGAA